MTASPLPQTPPLYVVTFGCMLTVLAAVFLSAPSSPTEAQARPIEEYSQGRAPHNTRALVCGEWQIVPVMDTGNMNPLKGVAAIASNDVLAVGERGITDYNHTHQLRWNGSQWSIPGPTPYVPYISRLHDVSAISSSEAWAVGWFRASLMGNLGERWNGSQWSTAYIPNGAGYYNTLLGVSARTPNDAWAVGLTTISIPNGREDNTLIAHWNGANWSVVLSPNVTGNNVLHSVSALSADDAWAVGYHGSGSLTLHWNGALWEIVPSPHNEVVTLADVDMIASDDVWAVRSIAGARPFTFHWNGSQWSAIDTPVSVSGALTSVDAVAPNDVWAVGSASTATGTLTIHWDGVQWEEIPGPNTGQVARLESVSALATGEVWAVGSTGSGTSTRSFSMRFLPAVCTPTPVPALTATPTATPTACPVDYGYTISTRTMVSATNLLPGSQCGQCVLPVQLPFPFTFYGHSYTSANISNQGNLQFITANLEQTMECPMPHPLLGPALLPHAYYFVDTSYHGPCIGAIGSPCGIYTELSGSAPNRVYTIDWRVRYSATSQHTAHFQVHLYEGSDTFEFAYNWVSYGGGAAAIGVQNGAGRYTQYSCRTFNTVMPGRVLTWRPLQCGISTPAPPSPTRTATPPPTQTQSATPSPQATNTPTSTATNVPTQTPGGPTATPVPPTATNVRATATSALTPTACAVHFTDVPSSNTFYPFVRCLACQGILGGYPCGGIGEPCNATNDPYFRPNNNITRSQIAKIVSESAGFNEAAGEQVFEDVPPAIFFYTWINRLANRGVMGGYECGTTPAEPCVPPGNRPYFRLNANATRGQLAKIVSEAAGFDEEHTSQTFEDVPTTNTFYIWVERLVSRQIMGGYLCGGPGEPCDPESRPYFRWGNTVTRGQASKIVANTFFPGCAVRER